MPAIRDFCALTVDPDAIAASSPRSCGAMPLPLRSAAASPRELAAMRVYWSI